MRKCLNKRFNTGTERRAAVCESQAVNTTPVVAAAGVFICYYN